MTLQYYEIWFFFSNTCQPENEVIIRWGEIIRFFYFELFAGVLKESYKTL